MHYSPKVDDFKPVQYGLQNAFYADEENEANEISAASMKEAEEEHQ